MGVITNEYRIQINPVADKAMFWDNDSFSAGLLRSFTPAITSPHLNIGAQKKIVLGPAGWFKKAVSLLWTGALAIVDVELDGDLDKYLCR